MHKKSSKVGGDALPDPLPTTCSVPAAGAHFFGVDRPAAYRLARKGVIPVLRIGTRNMVALPRVLAARLERDPKETGARQ
jgi:hypothetical protein